MGYKVTLIKGKNNMVGISIGGGSPFCPCLYVVQVFHRTPAADDGSLSPGDELVNVNGTSLQGLSRRETARIIQEARVGFACPYLRCALLCACAKQNALPLKLSWSVDGSAVQLILSWHESVERLCPGVCVRCILVQRLYSYLV